MASKLTTLAKQKSSDEIQTMSKDSLKWLKSKISDLGNPATVRSSINREEFRQKNNFGLGGLYFFYYSPIGKNDLPYYDKFPLVLVLEKYSDGILGLNLHYLPLQYRLAFLGKLMDFAVLDRKDDIKKMRVTYEILGASKRFKEFRPCLKKYLYGQIQSKILAIQPNEWDIASYLPIHMFAKAQPATVWQESLDQIRK
jgi:hypothetical protein